MFSLLLVLLIAGLLITMIGLFLTTRSEKKEEQTGYLISHRSSRISQSFAPRTGRMLEGYPSRRIRSIDPILLPGKQVVDAGPSGRQNIARPMPIANRRIVTSRPVYSGQVDDGYKIRLARYISASAVLEQLGLRRKGESVPISVMVIGLISIFILGIYALNFVLPHQALINLITFNLNNLNNPVKTTTQPPPNYNASQKLVRLSQLDPAQYNSTPEFQSWAYSACSTASMTEVFDAYGRHYRITDVLKVESQIGEITPQLGLLEDIGIQRTATRFGFNTQWGHNLSLNQIIAVASSGKPVIVSFPPDRYAGGHLLIVTGGDSNVVKLADSSLWNRKVLSRAQFLNWWEGFYAIVTPNK
jgi:hypothetical protein